MGKKSGPSAPTPPDPQQTIAAQTASNKETAVANANLNRINQYTPQGSLQFNQIGTNADGTPKYESRQTYSPGEQQLYDQQLGISNQLNQVAGQQIGRVSNAMGQNIDTGGFAPYQSNVQAGQIQGDIGFNGPGVQYGMGPSGPIQSQIGQTSGQIQNSFGGYGQIPTDFADVGGPQRGLDYSGVSRLPGTDDFSKESQQINDAVYNQATSRLDPRFQQEQSAMAASLAAKGVTEGSSAYNKAMDQFNRSKNDAYNQAQFSGIQAGANRQGQLFGMGLQARQQGVGEVNNQGQFANSAQQQAFQQAQARGEFGATQQQRQYDQSQGQAQFGNQAQQQEYEQAAGRGTFANAAQQQAFGQDQSRMDAANQAQQQGFSQAQTNAAFRNDAQNTAFNQASANAGLSNATRNQQFQEAAYQRNLPIQDIAALMGTAPGVQQPNFASYNPAQVANTNTAGITQQGYENQYAQYQAKQQARSAGLGSLFGLAGAGAQLAFSDRRLKADIERVGQTSAGIPTYTFRYIWDNIKRFGVMADEVLKAIPEAVGVDRGYLTVDYGKVI